MDILCIDQGTTNTKAVLVDHNGEIFLSASRPIASSYPQPGWVEQSANDIWITTKSAISEVVSNAACAQIDGVAIGNQRETIVCWDAQTSEPIAPAITWQCNRGLEICNTIVKLETQKRISELTGLSLSPLYPAAKAAWVMQNVPAAQKLSDEGRLRIGTVDTWLLWKLTNGAEFSTDYTNASRTQLFDTRELCWSEELCDLFGVPISALPTPKSSENTFGSVALGTTELTDLIPIAAILGDSHAALFGHGISKAGQAKATFGTGTSVMAVSPSRVNSTNGLSGTIAWSTKTGVVYAIEGNISVSGQAVQYISEILNVDGPEALSELAQTTTSSFGVTFVPALSGLGAPFWNENARGQITGLSHGSKPSHIARATFEAIALQVFEVVTAMELDSESKIDTIFVDGGASSNDFLMQLLSNILDKSVVRGSAVEVGAIGLAKLAIQSLNGTSMEALTVREQIQFLPKIDLLERSLIIENWKHAVALAVQ